MNWNLKLPRRVLRHLVVGHGIGPGARVLDAGCGDGALAGFLDRLGIAAVGLDGSPAAIESARRNFPQLEFHRQPSLSEPLPCAAGSFDLILLPPGAVGADNLLGAEAFQVTGNLLSCLRPSGQLVFLSHHAPPASGHAASCFLRHLCCFPGIVGSAVFSRGHWRWWSGRGPQSEYRTTSLRVPQQPIAPHAWRRLAETLAIAATGLCCEHSSSARSPQPLRSAA